MPCKARAVKGTKSLRSGLGSNMPLLIGGGTNRKGENDKRDGGNTLFCYNARITSFFRTTYRQQPTEAIWIHSVPCILVKVNPSRTAPSFRLQKNRRWSWELCTQEINTKDKSVHPLAPEWKPSMWSENLIGYRYSVGHTTKRTNNKKVRLILYSQGRIMNCEIGVLEIL